MALNQDGQQGGTPEGLDGLDGVTKVDHDHSAQAEIDRVATQQQQQQGMQVAGDVCPDMRRLSASEHQQQQGVPARRSSRLHHSMLISTFSQNVDDMMMPSDSMLNMAQHAQQQQQRDSVFLPGVQGDSSKGRSDDDGDKWLSPAPSFSASLSGKHHYHYRVSITITYHYDSVGAG